MKILLAIGVLLLAYVIGSIPFGLILVWLKTGQDVRSVASGRTGATNVMRAAGFWVGLITSLLDILKSAAAAWLAVWLLPTFYWMHVLAPFLAVLGHNYSIFLIEKTPNGLFRLRGGAGGTPSVGGAMGLWLPSFLILFPAGFVILFGVGYASIATISIGLVSALIFSIRAAMGLSPWQYIFYGLFVEILVLIALRQNIVRLFNGTERFVGWRPWKKKQEHANSAQ
jgi:acyl phosphate:glycerol-3-phosphate acyltransferase